MEDALQVRVAQLQAELDSLHKAITVLNQLAAELDIHTAMQNVRQVALELLDCERVTLFLIFERRRELRAMIDQGKILRIQFGEGIAGLVAQTGGSMNLPDAYEHPMFNKEVDRATGFRTRSMLCMAVSDMTGKNVAVLQALNKRSGQAFTPADERNLKLFGTHLGNTLVKAKLHETAKREKERLQAIYTCFKSLSAADEVGQMVVCATAALERHIIHADRVFFFLVDKPRGELWLHTHQAETLRLRVGPAGGVVGTCAETRKPQSWAEFSDPSRDPALRRLAPHLGPPGSGPPRIKSVLVQPIHGTSSDRVLAVVLAVNKREAEGTSDIFFEPFFTDADCDAMELFAYEVGDLLSERSLELSLLSALSVVGHDGAHPNCSTRPRGQGAGGVEGAGGAAGEDGTGGTEGGGEEEGGGGSEEGSGGHSRSGEEDLIRSKLIQMYLPDYKKEVSGSHSVFNRNSFSAATATANQVRASLERKRSALALDQIHGGACAGGGAALQAGCSPGYGVVYGAGGSQSATTKRVHARSNPALVFGSGGGMGGAGVRQGLAAALTAAAGFRSAWPGRGQGLRSLSGADDGPTSFIASSEPPASPPPGSDLSSDLQLLPDHHPYHLGHLGSLRCASSSQAEHPILTLRYAAGGSLSAGAGRTLGLGSGPLGSMGGSSGGWGLGYGHMHGGMGGGAGGAGSGLTWAATAAPAAVAAALVSGVKTPSPGPATLAHARGGGGGSKPPLARPMSGPCGFFAPGTSGSSPSPSLLSGGGQAVAWAATPQSPSPVSQQRPHSGPHMSGAAVTSAQAVEGNGVVSGGRGGGKLGMMGLGQLMEPWRRRPRRRPCAAASPPAGPVQASGDSCGGGSSSSNLGDGGVGVEMVCGNGRRGLSEEAAVSWGAEEEEEEEEEDEFLEGLDELGEGPRDAAAAASEGPLRISPPRTLTTRGGNGRRVCFLPEPGSQDARQPGAPLQGGAWRQGGSQQQQHPQQRGGAGGLYLSLPEMPQPFSHPLEAEGEVEVEALLVEGLGEEEEELEGWASGRHSGPADPQALRSHLSCVNLRQACSPRSPCFYIREQLDSWDWDFTESTVEELIKLAYDIFIVSGAMEEFALQPKVLRNFLTAVASHYHAIPYHNFNHVCHVLHATYLLSCTTHAASILTPLERLALLLAALCHDLDHDGHSNSFHINSASELSRIYNDQSVMENHHCAMTFAILSRTDCNVLAALAPEEQRAARKAIISAVLCTDMANHFAVTQEFQKHGVGYERESEGDRLLLLKVMLHAADIGNAVRPFHVNHAMSRRVHREFEAQAAEEVRLGLPVTFSVDTADHVMCARVELNFLDYVVSTLWERLVEVLPELAPQLDQLRVNRARYRRIADTGKTADQVLAEEAQQAVDPPSSATAAGDGSDGVQANPPTFAAVAAAAPEDEDAAGEAGTGAADLPASCSVPEQECWGPGPAPPSGALQLSYSSCSSDATTHPVEAAAAAAAAAADDVSGGVSGGSGEGGSCVPGAAAAFSHRVAAEGASAGAEAEAEVSGEGSSWGSSTAGVVATTASLPSPRPPPPPLDLRDSVLSDAQAPPSSAAAGSVWNKAAPS